MVLWLGGLLHSQLSTKKKWVMLAFKEGRIQLLISTTVIEVGDLMPPTSLMVIYDALHFGLAQLHQLRGRIGRGDREALCLLVGLPKTWDDETLSPHDWKPGWFLFERKNLEIRGRRCFLERKTIRPASFKMVDMVEDYPIMERVRKEVIHYVKCQAKDFNGESWLHEPPRDAIEGDCNESCNRLCTSRWRISRYPLYALWTCKSEIKQFCLINR